MQKKGCGAVLFGRRICTICCDFVSLDKVTVGDTIIQSKAEEIRRNLFQFVSDMVNRFGEYRLIVTDKYHGLIFSLISNTPVVVLRTKDHKVISGYEWFSRIYPDRVFFAESEEGLKACIAEIMQKPHYEQLG